VAVAPGMVVAIVIYAFGDVSGAHINPAVTLGFTLRRAFPWRRLPAYWLAQVVGAVLAALLMRLRFGSVGQLGASQPYAGTGTALAAETLLSTLLVLVILNVSTRESLLGGGAAVPVGLTIAVAGLLGGRVSGASMNPARSLGPSLAGAGTTHVWLYLLGPAIGAVLGCLITLAVHGRYKPRKDAAQGNGEDDVTTATRQPRAVWLSSWRVLGGARRPDLITARPVLSLSAGPRGGAAALGGVAQGWRGRARLRASG